MSQQHVNGVGDHIRRTPNDPVYRGHVEAFLAATKANTAELIDEVRRMADEDLGRERE
jgi:hypothetical protein